ncbi:MAG: ABC transporter substrate-binding protein [Roseinatronobacter sp.]
MSLDRRTFLATGAAATALAPRMALSASEIDALYEAARREGELSWYIVPLTSETAEEAGAMFTERFPGVRVNVVRSTAQVAFQRLNQDIETGIRNCDVFTTSNTAHAINLKSRDLLMPYRPEGINALIEDFRNADAEDMYQWVMASAIGIIYNSAEVSDEDAPKSWLDLLDPRWQDRVAIGHPGFSGFVGVWGVKMRELYGWDYFVRMEAQRPYIGRSIIDVSTTTAAGETLVGAASTASSLIVATRGNPVKVIYPTDGTVVVSSPSCILADAPNPNAAKLFTEFLMGPEFAEVVANSYGTPIRTGTPVLEGVAPLDEIPILTATTDQLVNEIPEVSEAFRDTFGI